MNDLNLLLIILSNESWWKSSILVIHLVDKILLLSTHFLGISLHAELSHRAELPLAPVLHHHEVHGAAGIHCMLQQQSKTEAEVPCHGLDNIWAGLQCGDDV